MNSPRRWARDQAPLFEDPRAPRPCEECGVTMRFVEGPDGNTIPVVEVRSVYRVVRGRLVRLELDAPIYVSHFETCPNAARFSRRNARS